MTHPVTSLLTAACCCLVALYTRLVPLPHGKATLVALLLRLPLPRYRCITTSLDGRRFVFDAGTKYAFEIFFYGTRERAETELVARLVEPGDILIDLGANIGWYTTLFSQLAGNTGSVVAIEPVPRTYSALRANLKLNRLPANVKTLPIMCGSREGTATIRVFPTLNPGLASARPYPGVASERVHVEVRRLDRLLRFLPEEPIALLKIDVEGAEYSAIKGAAGLFQHRRVQSLLIEANDERAAAFGYAFPDCLRYLRSTCPQYQIFAVRADRKGMPQLRELATCSDYEHGANLFIVQRGSSVWCRAVSRGLIPAPEQEH